jgi:hypothetical protein
MSAKFSTVIGSLGFVTAFKKRATTIKLNKPFQEGTFGLDLRTLAIGVRHPVPHKERTVLADGEQLRDTRRCDRSEKSTQSKI